MSPEERQALIAAYRANPVLPDAPALPLIAALRANWPPSVKALAADDLLAELLTTTPIYPAGLERALTAVRRSLLLGNLTDDLLPLVVSLAIQGHLNEYAWAATAEERQRVDGLAARIETLSPVEAMLLAAYTPLGRTPGAAALLTRGWGEPVASVLAEQITTAAEEDVLATQIAAITPIRHAVSDAVRAMYEANPFPRWRTVPRVPAADVVLGFPVPPSPQVLIAGCGTGYQTIIAAQRFATGQVTAIDLSRASLAYGMRKAREAGLTNIDFRQADIMEIADLDQRFDIIESTGVLHHMEDPFAAARTVCGLLKPGGLIKLALYSAAARAELKPAKTLARGFTPDRIPELRQAIADAAEGDPVREALRYIDFYATSPLRDLIMHIQEHELGFGDLRRIIAENGLEFLAFTTPAGVQHAYREMFPGHEPGADLDHWEALEAAQPQTFSGMYQFWLRKPG